MRFPERLARGLRRGEIRSAIVGGTAVAAVLALQAGLLFAFVAGEYVEEADRQLELQADFLERIAANEDLEHLTQVLEAATRGSADTALAVRLERADGSVVRTFGSWPDGGEPIALGSGPAAWGAALEVAPGRYVQRRVEGPGGLAFALALPLAHSAIELREVRDGLLAILGISFVAGVAIALVAVRRSLRPLRRATRLLAAIDAERIDTRLPDRGTGDFVDQHAATLNTVLDRLAAAFERLRSFTSDAAHELRTPVHRIRSTAEVGLMESADPGDTRRALQSILESVDELGRLVDALLLLARLDEGEQRIASSEIRVRDWLDGLLDLYRPVFVEHGIAVDARLEPITLRGDERLLDRGLCNLLDNALTHAGSGKRIEVSARAQGGGVEVAVSDAGPGVPPGERERIFDRFARLEGARGARGAGVGLALARAIARAHGGTLVAGASSLGGARFVLWLPASADGVAAPAPGMLGGSPGMLGG